MIGELQGEFGDLDNKYLNKISQRVGQQDREASGEHYSCACLTG